MLFLSDFYLSHLLFLSLSIHLFNKFNGFLLCITVIGYQKTVFVLLFFTIRPWIWDCLLGMIFKLVLELLNFYIKLFNSLLQLFFLQFFFQYFFFAEWRCTILSLAFCFFLFLIRFRGLLGIIGLNYLLWNNITLLLNEIFFMFQRLMWWFYFTTLIAWLYFYKKILRIFSSFMLYSLKRIYKKSLDILNILFWGFWTHFLVLLLWALNNFFRQDLARIWNLRIFVFRLN